MLVITKEKNWIVFSVVATFTVMFYFLVQNKSYIHLLPVADGNFSVFQFMKIEKGSAYRTVGHSDEFKDRISVKQTEFWDKLFAEFRVSKNSSVCGSNKSRSSGHYSKISGVSINETGGNVEFTIALFNVKNERKSFGGDVVLVRAEHVSRWENSRTHRVAGQVTDNNDGTYTAKVEMLWSGPTVIYTEIASKFEHYCRRLRAIFLYGESIFALRKPHNSLMTFMSKGKKEVTRCSPSEHIYGYETICNLTDSNYGMSYYCGTPSHEKLPCSTATLVSHKSNYPVIMKDEDLVIPPFIESLTDIITVNFTNVNRINRKRLTPCSKRAPRLSWRDPFPSGIGLNEGWKYSYCEHKQFRNPSDIKRCLEGKKIFIQGDSTVRQYLEALKSYGNFSNEIMKRKNFLEFNATKENVEMSWHIHEFPYHCGSSVSTCVADSVALRITDLAKDNKNDPSGKHTVVLLTYNAHLQCYHTDVLKSRLRGIIAPIKLLIRKKPFAKIFFKGPHPCFEERKWFDVRIALLYRDIIYQELQPILDHVIYLDTFSIGVTYSNHALHPQGAMLRGQIDQLLAYIC